jgi:ParB-like chromosome segregation protein Spo0J
MGRSKGPATKQTQPAPADALAGIRSITAELTKLVAAMPLDERVAALNEIRTALHETSPFRDEPVDLVLWVRSETVDPNDYNPNRVAPPEMRLLALSIEEDGYTQPIVTTAQGAADEGDRIGNSETVDGFHRGRAGKDVPSIRERVHGYLPITRVNISRSGRADRIASTIRHNRARGVHQVGSMSEIVRMLHLAGWPDDKIQKELGMQHDEVLRLKQTTGLAALFADREFSQAWEPDTRVRD